MGCSSTGVRGLARAAASVLLSVVVGSIGPGALAGDLPGRFVEIRPLEPPVQSVFDEVQPVPCSDGRRLFFASNREGALGDADIWEATRSVVDGPFTHVRHVTELELSTPEGDYPTYATSDGRVLCFQSTFPFGDHDLFVAWRSDPEGVFTEKRSLDEINTADHEGGASLTADGRVIVFVSNRPGGAGLRDLWIATRENGDDPESPFDPDSVRNLDEINTAADEAYPSISPDGLTLFWSDLFNWRPGGQGLPDLWFATRPDRDSRFGPAQNLTALNTGRADFFMRVSNRWPAESDVYFTRCTDDFCEEDTDLFVARWIPDPRFRRGDANADDVLDIADVMHDLQFLFLGGRVPPCLDAADADDDGELDITDPVVILFHLFTGEATIPAGPCGFDSTEDGLDCASFPPCEDS